MNASYKNMLNVGDVLNNKWVILEYIDKGGMGEIYRAHQISLNRDVAIKVISQEWLESFDKDSRDVEMAVQRFRREVEAMAQISHPNILQVFDHDSITVKSCDQDRRIEYIVMEFVPGGSFRATMSEEGFYPDQTDLKNWITNYFFPALSGIQALHDIGIVHRDLKPENILMDNATPKVADFGLVRSHRLKPITQSVDVLGSPRYMSPEHFFDLKNADKRADTYSLGKILFEAVSGKMKQGTIPFKSVRLEKAESPFFQQLSRIIQIATAENRDERTESVQVFRDQLEQVINGHDNQKPANISHRSLSALLYSPKRIWTVIILVILSVSVMTVWYLTGKAGLNSVKSIVSKYIGRHDIQTKSVMPDKTDGSFISEHIGKQRFFSGGEFIMAGVTGKNKKLQVDSFYMDDVLVTNQQFVDFLNHNLARLNLENSVVKGDGANWLMLGEVYGGYEPIVYRNKEFHVTDPSYASKPVLRITGFGASAFARYFDRRLPTDIEILYAALKREEPGIQVVNKSIGEWGLISLLTSSEDQTKVNQYAVIGGLEGTPEDKNSLPKIVDRLPWEACEDTGFRTVKKTADR